MTSRTGHGCGALLQIRDITRHRFKACTHRLNCNLGSSTSLNMTNTKQISFGKMYIIEITAANSSTDFRKETFSRFSSMSSFRTFSTDTIFFLVSWFDTIKALFDSINVFTLSPIVLTCAVRVVTFAPRANRFAMLLWKRAKKNLNFDWQVVPTDFKLGADRLPA